MQQVIVVPMLDSMLGAIVPARTWFGILMSALGVAMLECSGSPPNVSIVYMNFLTAFFNEEKSREKKIEDKSGRVIGGFLTYNIKNSPKV